MPATRFKCGLCKHCIEPRLKKKCLANATVQPQLQDALSAQSPLQPRTQKEFHYVAPENRPASWQDRRSRFSTIDLGWRQRRDEPSTHPPAPTRMSDQEKDKAQQEYLKWKQQQQV